MQGHAFKLVPIIVGSLSTERCATDATDAWFHPPPRTLAEVVTIQPLEPTSPPNCRVSPRSEAEYGALLAPYLDDPSNAFVISSDFCHWGRRFSFTTYFEVRARVYLPTWCVGCPRKTMARDAL
jgi:hypothetical protein